MNLLYINHLDKYIAEDGTLYTDEQLDLLSQLESNWKDSQSHYTFQQLIEIFPEATKPARRAIKAEIKHYKKLLSKASVDQEKDYDKVISKAHFKEQTFLKFSSDKYYDDLRKKIESKIKIRVFRLSYLDGTPTTTRGVNEADVARAKEIPIENFYDGKLRKHGKRAVGPCPFHSEKTASFTVYLDQNTWWCYGACGTGGSVVDFVIKQQNVDFLSAVKLILK